MRVEGLRDEVALRAERIAVELLPQLPDRLRGRLEMLEQRAAAEGDELEDWVRIEGDILAFGEVVDEVLRLAPKIDKSFNRLPRGFPPREKASGFVFFDVFDQRLARLRENLHEAVLELDAKAEIHDARSGYFDQMERPFLVEASFRVDGHPFRFQVVGPQQQNDFGAGSLSLRGMRLVLITLVRPSTPALQFEVSWLHSLKVLLRLKQKVTTGDERIDRRIAVKALQVDGSRAFTPQLQQAVWALLQEAFRPKLMVTVGRARLEWQQQSDVATALPSAIAVLVALRELKPVVLLHRHKAPAEQP